MKLIVAIIQPNKLDYIASAMRRANTAGITVTQARGFGHENVEYDWDKSGALTHKLKIEIVVSDESCDELLMLIQNTIGTGKADHGFIYVTDVLKTVHISPGHSESNESISTN